MIEYGAIARIVNISGSVACGDFGVGVGTLNPKSE
jgi:hypothetical protein